VEEHLRRIASRYPLVTVVTASGASRAVGRAAPVPGSILASKQIGAYARISRLPPVGVCHSCRRTVPRRIAPHPAGPSSPRTVPAFHSSCACLRTGTASQA
jgi:hypothetical protein